MHIKTHTATFDSIAFRLVCKELNDVPCIVLITTSELNDLKNLISLSA